MPNPTKQSFLETEPAPMVDVIKDPKVMQALAEEADKFAQWKSDARKRHRLIGL